MSPRWRGYDVDELYDLELLERPAPPVRWSAHLIEGLRRAEIHECWRRVHGRRRIKLGTWPEGT
jgi:hypothetical protein